MKDKLDNVIEELYTLFLQNGFEEYNASYEEDSGYFVAFEKDDIEIAVWLIPYDDEIMYEASVEGTMISGDNVKDANSLFDEIMSYLK